MLINLQNDGWLMTGGRSDAYSTKFVAIVLRAQLGDSDCNAKAMDSNTTVLIEEPMVPL